MMSIHDLTKPLIGGVARILSRLVWLGAVLLILLPWVDVPPALLGGVALVLIAIGAVFAGAR
jgi:hypothetical protein